ncbi:hypothetical protein HG535_0D05500 [Zygotorulaspora mrakii]|uniref:Large ribosomal subunit protein mL40 n=1 Tax=Zygotorulaspora mrakii TaxID=42260 RepID=A0A7H9B2F5_ZYGMR|nr:uncharacterized protein HG535_0D05500 [Zygotorulaspora mrakii]QLG72841.1 hypothetical protein HG535_0D05500 [Zygotorulaspora mrakii]
MYFQVPCIDGLIIAFVVTFHPFCMIITFFQIQHATLTDLLTILERQIKQMFESSSGSRLGLTLMSNMLLINKCALGAAPAKNPSIGQFSVIFTRGKRTKSKGGLPPLAQRVITQLSVLSASRKQPKLLKLSREDLIKHETIQRCWSTYQAELRAKRNEQLKLQYKSISKAMNLLSELNPKLYEAAKSEEQGKRFPMDLRVPTEYPPNKIWYHAFKEKE